MKISIDIQPAVSQKAGIGRYASELVAHLPKRDDLDFELFYFDFKGKGRPPKAPNCTFRRYTALPGMLFQQAWKRIGWPRFDSLARDADLYHFTNFIIPPLSANKRAVTSIHDISFILHPEFAEKKNLDYLSKRIRATCERADAVITISKQSARDLNERLGVPQEKIHPIYLGISPLFTPSQPDEIKETRRNLALEKPFILMVGTFEPRKNVPFAVDIFERMESFDGDLVIVGQKGWKNESIFQRIKASPCASRIKTFTALPDKHLVALYSAAEFFLMTSLYEGFGFPPLEAMSCGTPVLTSAGGSLSEVCGEAAEVIDSADPELWLDKAQSLLHDSELRNDLIEKGLSHVKKYTWQNTAEGHVATYMKVLQ
jgi:glycosyltransferase involved in cell wall biosynthesis